MALTSPSMKPLLGILVAAALLPSAAIAQEREAIVGFDVRIDVRDGGVMTVREEIRVRAMGREIRRGIYRDVPTSFPRRAGLGRIEAPFSVRSVTRDGTPEPYVVETTGGPLGRRGARVRIGSADVFLDPGVYTYAIEYETSRWVEFGDGRDRLYWNVTGNGWAFPIERARAEIRVEGLRSEPQLESWTGREGSTETDATARWDSSSRVAVFEVGSTLVPGEGLTVRVTFPSGVLTAPSSDDLAQWRRLDWGGWIDTGWAVLGIVALYLLMWRSVGVDPPPGRTGIETTPPEGYSPAALGFIESRGYDQSQLSAALVSMALKGAIRIEREDDAWTLRKLAEPHDLEEPLSDEEATLFDELLGPRTSLRLSSTNHAELRQGIKAFRSSLARRFEREYFVNNRRWFVAGVVLSVLAFGILAWRWRFDVNPIALFLGVWLTGWTVGVATLAYRLVQQFRAARTSGGVGLWASTGFLALFSVPFFIAEIVVTGLLFTLVPVHLVAAAVGIGITNVVFYHLLERPTLRGRGVLDRLDGFRSYLESTADAAERRGHAPDRDLPLYQRLLPFAIAVGAASRWTEGFRDALAPALAGEQAYPYFDWYHDDQSDVGADPQAFASALSSGLPSTLSSMSSPPSSGGSGGGFSSGGGSSGGGGGGGGGGGW